MKYLKHLSLVALIVTATGCASKYQMDKGTIAFKSGLTKDSALKVVKKTAKADKTQRGLCSSVQNFFVPPSVINDYKFDKFEVEYEGKYTKKVRSTYNLIDEKLATEFPFTSKENNSINANLIKSKAKVTAIEKGKSLDKDQSFTVSVSVPLTYSVDMQDVKEIRLFKGLEQDDHRGCRTAMPADNIVWVTVPQEEGNISKPFHVRFNVSEQKIKKFIAALSYLNPEAPVVVGAGL